MNTATFRDDFKFKISVLFVKGDCKRCPIVKYKEHFTSKGTPHTYYTKYCPFGCSKDSCPIEVEPSPTESVSEAFDRLRDVGIIDENGDVIDAYKGIVVKKTEKSPDLPLDKSQKV